MLYKCEVRHSRIHGHGVFATEPLAPGEVWWEMAPDNEQRYWLRVDVRRARGGRGGGVMRPQDISVFPESWTFLVYQASGARGVGLCVVS